MKLEMHDGDTGNSHASNAYVDYDYQAEMWVQETCNEATSFGPIIRWILFDGDGSCRCEWERKGNTIDIVNRSPRFTGEWSAPFPIPTRAGNRV